MSTFRDRVKKTQKLNYLNWHFSYIKTLSDAKHFLQLFDKKNIAFINAVTVLKHFLVHRLNRWKMCHFVILESGNCEEQEAGAKMVKKPVV